MLLLEQENQLGKEIGQNGNPLTPFKILLNHEMMERMYMYHALKMLDDDSFTTCQFCSEIYPHAQANKLKCSATHDFFVDNSEQRI